MPEKKRMNNPSNHLNPFWSQPLDRLLTSLNSSAAGLSSAEAARRLQQGGPNTLKAGRQVTALVSNLPERIGQREVRRVLERLSWDPACGRTETVVATGPGNCVEVEIAATAVTERFTAFGRPGASAERVADELVGEVRDHLSSGAPVGCHLADQLLLPLSLSAWLPGTRGQRRGGAFRTGPLSRHTTTHIDVCRRFLGVRIDVAPEREGRACVVSVGPPE